MTARVNPRRHNLHSSHTPEIGTSTSAILRFRSDVPTHPEEASCRHMLSSSDRKIRFFGKRKITAWASRRRTPRGSLLLVSRPGEMDMVSVCTPAQTQQKKRAALILHQLNQLSGSELEYHRPENSLPEISFNSNQDITALPRIQISA